MKSYVLEIMKKDLEFRRDKLKEVGDFFNGYPCTTAKDLVRENTLYVARSIEAMEWISGLPDD